MSDVLPEWIPYSPVTLSLPAVLALELWDAAEARGVTREKLVREIVVTWLARQRGQLLSALHPSADGVLMASPDDAENVQ